MARLTAKRFKEVIMIPYNNFTFFLWLLLPVVPAIIFGMVQASPKTRSLWILHSSIIMLYFILRPQDVFDQAVMYFIWEFLIIRLYLKYRQSEARQNRASVFYLALTASLLPLIFIKFVSTPEINALQTLFGLQNSKTLSTHSGQVVQGVHSLTNKLASVNSRAGTPSPAKLGSNSFASANLSSGNLSSANSGTANLGAVGLNQLATATIGNSIFGFLGVSYVTFRIVGTLIEIRDGLIKEVGLGDFISFVLFFPTLASGPIDRYRRFLKDLRKTLTRQEYLTYLIQGLEYISRGFLYKFIIAYLINEYALSKLTHTHTLWSNVQYMYAYSAYLFFDFAGYSAFAIGVSLFFGINTPENFKAPFWSKNIKDFWNRWHISLSMWFRDYIYMRFMLDSAKKKRINNRYIASATGYLLLFLLMGLWHGTQWHYIIYGLYMALLMIGFEFLERFNKAKHFWGEGKSWDMLARFFTLQFVCFGLLIFSGRIF